MGRSKAGARHRKIVGDEKVNPSFLKEAFRVMTNMSVIYLFCDWKNSHEWYTEMINAGFTVRSQVVWDRCHHGMGDLRGAHSPTHDIVWMGTKGRPVFDGKRPQSVLRSKRPSPSQDHGHPTCKPVDLIEQLILPWGAEFTILDMFMGSGSTGVACMNTGRKFIGIELDADYYDIAANRIVGAMV